MAWQSAGGFWFAGDEEHGVLGLVVSEVVQYAPDLAWDILFDFFTVACVLTGQLQLTLHKIRSNPCILPHFYESQRLY